MLTEVLNTNMPKIDSEEEESVFDFQSADTESIPELRDRLRLRGLNEKWILEKSEIIIDDAPFAKGSFGTLYKIKWRGLACVARTYPGTEFENLKNMANEIAVLSSLRHPHVVMFLGACIEENNTILIMEECSGGSLDSKLRSLHEGKKLKRSKAFQYVKELALGLHFLHESHVVHRSINPNSVLLSADERIKISNFGSSMFLTEGTIKDGYAHHDSCDSYPVGYTTSCILYN
jgi:serine/threonine protein kinase